MRVPHVPDGIDGPSMGVSRRFAIGTLLAEAHWSSRAVLGSLTTHVVQHDRTMQGKLQLLREVQHVYPQLGVLGHGIYPDFIGRLEHFDDDWQHVVDTYLPKLRDYTFDPQLGPHNSSNYEAGTAAKHLVENDMGFVVVLYELLKLEYLCWGYEAPV